MTGMFEVLKGGVIYTGVVEENGRWVDSAGRDLTNGKLLGTFLGSQYANGKYYRYYRNGLHIWQWSDSDNGYHWFCDVAIEDTMKHVWTSK